MSLEFVVGSKKSFKIDAVRELVNQHFREIQASAVGIEVDTGVSKQPFSRDETIQGARNRSLEALKNSPDASFGVGLEGGVFQEGDNFYVFDVAAITIATDPVQTFVGESDVYLLPTEVAAELLDGRELSEAMQIYLNTSGSTVPLAEVKQNGAIYYLSNQQKNRDQSHMQALENAMQQMDEFLEAK